MKKRLSLFFLCCFLLVGIANELMAQDSVKTFLRVPPKLDTLYKKSFLNTFDLDKEISKKKDKNWFNRTLYKYMVVSNDTTKAPKPKRVQYNSALEGKPIRKISIRQYPVLGESIDEVESTDVNALSKLGNKLHVNTREEVLLSFLVIGNAVDSLEIQDSERLLRTQSFIDEARIDLLEIEGTDSVDVVLNVRDSWSTQLEASPESYDSYDVSLSENNLLGLGHELVTNVTISSESRSNYDFWSAYRIRNIFHQFINFEVRYLNRLEEKGSAIKVNRDFVTPEISLAGAVLWSKKDFLKSSTLDPTLQYNYTEENIDVWAGWAFQPVHFKKYRRNIIVSGKVNRTVYLEKPKEDNIHAEEYQDHFLLLGSLALLERNYIPVRNVYNIDIVEDLPLGFVMKGTFGQQFRDSGNRFYTAVDMTSAFKLKKKSYLFLRAAAGSFFSTSEAEEGVVLGEANFITNAFSGVNTRMRQYINFRYKIGINQLPGRFLSFNNIDKIVSISGNDFRGKERLLINMENVYFSNRKFLGYRLAGTLHADMAWITGQSSDLFREQLYYGFGGGVKLRNDRIIFKTIELKVTYYPEVPNHRDAFPFRISFVFVRPINDFRNVAPSVLRFD